MCPGRDIAHLTHGQVIETLVANRLTAPAPLWRVEDWAREWAVEEVFGVEPELLNDDRLGRALDAIAPHLTELTDSIGARAIGEFGIDVSTCHWDMTSMSLHGAYPAEDQDEDYPRIKHGHPKDRRYDLKQIQTGLAVTGDGGIPLLSRVIDGGAAEISQITGTMKALRAIAGPKEFLLVADSKLVSYRNVTALIKAGCDFIAPAPASAVDDAVYAALDLDAATIVDYAPARDENTPAERRETYRVLEDTHVLSGPRKRDAQVEVRRILVHSTGNAKGQQRARDKRLAKARDELDKLQRGAGGRYYNTAEKIAARIGVIAKTRRVSGCLHTEITTDDTGRPTLDWHFDQDVLQAEAAARAGRRRRGAAAPQGPAGHGRAPLRRLQGPPGRHPRLRAGQQASRRTGGGGLPDTARVLPDRAPGPPVPRGRPENARAVSRQPAGPPHRPRDPLPPLRPTAAGRSCHRPTHHRHQPRRPAPPPRPPRPGTTHPRWPET
ncbi:IS1634 family transposase [Streptomyces sp. NPDC056178]|uniref:IS1634 family transposase n=1 Tax=unclassified Streptomyces TaxID=2593676 RepID=UPI0035DCDABB